MTFSVSIAQNWGEFSLDVTFQAPAGITALYGRSGAGKTSVVNAIAGVFAPKQGLIGVNDRVLLDTAHGVNLPPHHRGVGYVFQDARLFPHMSVRGNLDYARRYGQARPVNGQFDHVVELLGIRALLDRRPAALSGGEKQRVAIARALLSDPQVLLMDEPLAALDDARKGEILPYLERLRDQVQIPIIYVSHSVSEIARLAGHVVVLDAGRVIAAGDTQSVLSDLDVVTKMGVRNAGAILPATIAAHETDGLTRLQVSGGALYLPHVNAPIGSHLRVRILAQDVNIMTVKPHDISALNILECRIDAIRIGDGPGALVSMVAGDDKILARITRRSVAALELQVGQTCYAVIKTVSVNPVEVGAYCAV